MIKLIYISMNTKYLQKGNCSITLIDIFRQLNISLIKGTVRVVLNGITESPGIDSF